MKAKKQVLGGRNRAKGVTVGIEINGLVEDLQFQLFSDPHMEDAEILSYLVVGQDMTGGTKKKVNLFNPKEYSFGIQGSTSNAGEYQELLGSDKFRNMDGADNTSTSVGLGRNVTRNLFISYDVDMFTQQGQFRVRYDLSRGFFVETRSSSETTGADLLYIFER